MSRVQSYLGHPASRQARSAVHRDFSSVPAPITSLVANKAITTKNTHTYLPAAEHKNTATPAMSSGSPSRPMGLSLLSSSIPPRLSMRPCASLDGKKPGAMMLDVIFLGPSSTEKLRARCCRKTEDV